MSASPSPRTPAAPPAREGGRILVDQLKIHGADRAFGVAGESFLAVLDAFVDVDIPFIACRQEGGAAMMAEAHGKLTGRPGICFVTRGPGATNASAGVHIAHQDSTPMILFIGQASRAVLDREAFQEVDFRVMFAPLCKWVAQIDRTERIPEYVSRAFHVATSGRPGPVVLSLPEDVLTEMAAVADVGRYQVIQPLAHESQLREVRDRLMAAQRPLMVVGGGGWNTQASTDLSLFADAYDLPTVASFRCQDYLDNDHQRYCGDLGLALNPVLAERFRQADLLLVVGARMGEVSSRGYTLIESPTPRQTLLHVHADSGELGRVFRPAVAINASAPSFFAAAGALPRLASAPWRAWSEAARNDYLAWAKPIDSPGPLQLAPIVAALREALPADTIVSNGAGNYTAWLHRFFRFHRYRTQLGPTSGSMGYGLPAAVAASIIHGDRPVVCFAGDGCFLMHGQELATAVQYGGKPIVIVVNNGSLGTIRAHQERRYPGRVSGTTLHNPDFAAYARAFGAHGETVTATAEFAPAFGRARASGRAAVIEVKLDVEVLTVSATLSQIRAAAIKGKV
ncbi:MAG TPA: thiamine pyrophosphate-binding protein [Polyangia bacterium]|jgi:acetolactate synthase-1/2/3 large subunit|nr:thiamine pyrophosphate-binding protein [Polyangia bacterium]